MLKISTKMMAMTTLIMSTLMVMSSMNWFSMWMGLEINMISFITMLKENKNISSSETMMMYFLIQSMSSVVFIFMIIMNPILLINTDKGTTILTTIMTLSMMMKLGIAPLHMWFINIMKKMSWKNCTIIMTWQKIAPLYIMTNINQNYMIIYMCAIISAMMGAIGGINQTSMKSILGFSSVNHLSWMILCVKFDNEMWIKYLIIYSIMVTMLTKMMDFNSINYISQMNQNIKNNMTKMNIIIMMMSLGGLPPFIGFLPKWIVINAMINNSSMIVIMILMFSSMITLFYYMRLMSPIIMLNNTMNKWNIKSSQIKNYNLFMLMINLSLPLSMMMNMN